MTLADVAVSRALHGEAIGASRAVTRWLNTCFHAPAFIAVMGKPRVLNAAGAASPVPPSVERFDTEAYSDFSAK